MSNATIRAYFESKLTTFAAAQSSIIPIAYEDRPFTPPSSGSYLEPFLLPSPTMNVTVNGLRSRYMGIFQVNVYVKSGLGSKASEALVQQIINLFPVIPKDSDVSVEQTPYATRVSQELSGWKCTPITIRYRMEV